MVGIVRWYVFPEGWWKKTYLGSTVVGFEHVLYGDSMRFGRRGLPGQAISSHALQLWRRFMRPAAAASNFLCFRPAALDSPVTARAARSSMIWSFERSIALCNSTGGAEQLSSWGGQESDGSSVYISYVPSAVSEFAVPVITYPSCVAFSNRFLKRL
jgi:hypothetical protein